jgi:hypothetical protein
MHMPQRMQAPASMVWGFFFWPLMHPWGQERAQTPQPLQISGSMA